MSLPNKLPIIAALLAGLCGPGLTADDAKLSLSLPIPAGAKIFIAPLEGGFENYLTAGLVKKKVPLTIVNSREKAEFELTGVAESEKAGWAKMLIIGTDQSREQAGIKLTKIDTGEVVFAYAVHKGTSFRGKQSAAESCAKHLKARIEGK